MSCIGKEASMMILQQNITLGVDSYVKVTNLVEETGTKDQQGNMVFG